jgi:DNA-binding NtrC family response regulator
VDCSTLPKTLMESELFGHEKGAFTGALQRKTGLIEQAGHGTLFLDEVANLTMEAQAKLLQFLQDFSIYRIGGQKRIRLDLRVLAASNVPLDQLVKRGAFREDLFYRLCVVDVSLPPLARRREDLPELCTHFIGLFCAAAGKPPMRLSPAAHQKLYGHGWPGNIRELKNILQRAVLFCEDDEIGEAHIQLERAGGGPGAEPAGAPARAEARPRNTPYHVLMEFPKEAMTDLLKKHRGKVVRAARELSVTPRSLYYYFKRYDIDIDAYR